jgi:hypothetical protein
MMLKRSAQEVSGCGERRFIILLEVEHLWWTPVPANCSRSCSHHTLELVLEKVTWA